MKKRIALLAAITLLAGICTVPVSASVTVTPQSDVLVRYDFEADGASGVFASKGTLSNDVRADGDNKVQRVQNSGGSVTSANDTMFNLPYIPEVMEISYDINPYGYYSANFNPEEDWFSTYLKVGTGNGDEENFYARHRFPKLFAMGGKLYYKVAGGNADVVSSTGATYSTAQYGWTTIIIRINNKTKTSEVFAKAQGGTEETKLGESKNIEIKTNTFGIEMCMKNTKRVELYLDNFTVRDITSGTSLSISSLSADNGLTASVKVPSNASRAELLCEGTKIADLDASVNKSFKITADAADVIKNYGTEKFELVCYNAANEVVDTVAAYKEVSADVYSPKYTRDKITGTITETDTAAADKVSQSLFTDFKPIKNATTKWSFDIAKTAEIDKMGVQFRIIGNNDSYNGKAWLPDQFLAADKSVYDNALIDSKDMELNKKYHFDIVFNPFTRLIYFDVSKDGSNIFHMEKPFIRMYTETNVPLYGINELGYVFKAKQGGRGALQITDMTFSALEEMTVPQVSAYTLASGESVSATGGNIPASAKSVSASVANFSGIDTSNVKLLKNGTEVSGALADLSGNTLKVSSSFDKGYYQILIPAGAKYMGQTLSLPIAIPFDTVSEFAIISPANGSACDANGTKILVSDDGEMTGVELYVNGTPCTMTKNISGIWEYSFVPTEPGSVTAEAVASYEGGTTKKISVAFSVKNTAELFNPGVKIAADTGFIAKGNGKYGATGNTDRKLKYTLLEERNNTKWNGILKFGYDISFSDVSKFALAFEAQHTKAWGAYPLNENGSIPLIENGWAKDAYGNNAYQYTANRTYRFEYEYDMTNKVQNAYVTDLSTGKKTTLGKNIQIQHGNGSWTAPGVTLIPDNAYLWQMQLYVIQAADATENDTFTISNGYFKKVMDVPEISAVAYEKDGAFISSLNDTVKASAKLKYTLSSSAFDAGSMTKSNIKLLKNGTEVTLSEASYTAPELTVVPEGGIDANAEYKLVITKAATVSGASIGLPVVKTVKTANESGLYFGNIEMTKTDSKVNAKVAYSSSESAAVPAVLIIAVYNGNRMTDINVSDVKSVSGTGYLETEVSYKSADVLSAKAFVWKALDSAEPHGIEKSISLAQPTE